MSRRVVVATRNPGKVRELAVLLAPLGLDLVPLDAVAPDAPEVVEDGETFEANAVKKARAAAAATGCPAIADDSGLEVDALGGAPGVRSARYAGSGGDRAHRDDANNRRLLLDLAARPDAGRGARFRCVLVHVEAADAEPVVAEGACEGRIAEAPRGAGGFGYDPLFVPDGETRTMAELTADEKNARSHRAAAARALAAALAVGR